MEIKTCRECGLSKGIDEYYVHSEMKDGHLNKCKWCVKERIRIYRKNHREIIRGIDKKAYDKKKHTPTYKTKAKKRQAKNRTPEKARARHLAEIKLSMFKPELCEKCKEQPAKCAHHHDYSKPLDVVWLCPTCHNRIHFSKEANLF